MRLTVNGRRSGRLRGMVAIALASMATLSACTGLNPGAAGQAPDASGSGTGSAPSQATTTGIVQGSDGWSTYTNVKAGFSIRFPTQVYSPSASCIVRKHKTKTVAGPVPATVQAGTGSDTGYFSVTQKYVFARAYGCKQHSVTWAALQMWPLPETAMYFWVHPASTQSDVEKLQRTDFGSCKKMSFTFTPSSSGSWTDVSFTCPGESSSVAETPEMRWYPKQGLFVQFFHFGYLPAVESPAQKNVEQQIVASFAPL